MDRVSELRGAGAGAGGSDSTLDTTSPPSEAFMSANETSSKYFSLSDSTFDITPIKDVSLASTAAPSDNTITDDDLISNLSPIGKKDLDSYKIGKQIEAANILSGGVDIFDDNDNSFDGDELVIDDNVEIDDKSDQKDDEFKTEDTSSQPTLVSSEDIPSKDTEVLLQIDGKNVDAIDIGNGLYLYRKDGQEELAAVQIIDDGHSQPTFKFLKVRENAEGNLEVYEEIEIEIPKEVPTKEEAGSLEKKSSQKPVTDNKVISDPTNNKVAEVNKTPQKVPTASTSEETEVKEQIDKPEVNLKGKMMKFSESRKSPVVGSFTPMTYHSTPNKEGKPLTKTMVDLQLHPSRHSDNVKKTIEVHTDSTKQKPAESQKKQPETTKITEIIDTAEKPTEQGPAAVKPIDKVEIIEQTELKIEDSEPKNKDSGENKIELKEAVTIKPKLDQIIIDDDVESNEAGNLVIDEKQQAISTEPVLEAKKAIQSEEKAIFQDTTKINVMPTPTSGPIREKEDFKVKSTEKKDEENVIEKPIILNEVKVIEKLGATESHLQSTDKNESKALEVLDTKNSDFSKKDEKMIQLSESKEDIMITQNPKPALATTQSDKSSEKQTNLLDKADKAGETAVKSKDIDTPIIDLDKNKEKLDVSKSSSSNLAVVGNKLSVNKVVGDNQQYKPNVINTMTNITQIAQPNMPRKIEQNKAGISNPVSVQSIQTPALKTSDPKVITKNEPVPLIKDTTTIKQGTVVDKKPSSTELSKPIDSKNKTDFSKSVEPKDNKDLIIGKPNPDLKPINNNHNAVPFGKWTEVNRQEFLNKFKEHKAPINTNSKQIKNSNDLNRRDVLKKIDSQRQSNIASSKDKPLPVKNEIIFSNKVPPTKSESKIPVKKDVIEVKPKVIEPVKSISKQEITQKSVKPVASSTVSSSTTTTTKVTKKEPLVQNEPVSVPSAAPSVSKSEPARREVNAAAPSHREVNVKSLINKTIEDMLNKVTSFPPLPSKAISDEAKHHDRKDQVPLKVEQTTSKLKVDKKQNVNQPIKILDDIEMKMNELHGIPFVERPAHELPKVNQLDGKSSSTLDLETTLSKSIKITKNELVSKKSEIIEVDSDEEVIEHEPITGDIELNNKTSIPKLPSQDVNVKMNINPTLRNEASKTEAVITETDFDKFARRNSVTYDNCVTVNLEPKDSHGMNVKKKETFSTTNPKKELIHLEPKSKLHPIRPHNTYSRKPLPNTSVSGDPNSKNYQSKIHIAYQSMLTAKMDRQTNRPVERPITIIEDKPVKVVFMDAGAEFVPGQLNVQGKELSPAKKHSVEQDALTVSTTEYIDKSDQTEESKQNEDIKTKTKHQRKQVLTPVDAPELELIQPGDIEVSPKKKRKTDDNKTDKHYKNLIHKKSYLLGRSTNTDEKTHSDLPKTFSNNENKIDETQIANVNTATALDSLVKAAELIENQESLNTTTTTTSDSPQNVQVKRGRGRPRKYPLPGAPTDDAKVPIPEKKPRLIDAKPMKEDSISDDDDSSDEGIIKENWTMGKINENIVCPICNKLFRSENVVFKHVKHCTGVSPNRSDSDKRSPRRDRRSQDSDNKSLDSRSDDMDIDSDEKLSEAKKRSPKKRKSKETVAKNVTDTAEVIVIEDTPVKPKQENVNKTAEKTTDERPKGMKKTTKDKVLQRSNNLVCEFCGKAFRQLSYLVSHRHQHKGDEEKKREKEKDSEPANKPQVFSCEVCKKEFRKLHHLVQHRIIHNPNTMPARNTRKTSAEHNDKVTSKDDTIAKQSEDPSAAFRCEPCDKSFRKLHHLVEHRETHDGINRQKVSVTAAAVADKPPPPPQCDVCKKTFRKLHHLIEHKEQHAETSSEKSDDKSALSTKDIIHECPLCYMVFPNEHSLNKHSGICQKKKRQSKLAKNTVEEDGEVKSDEVLTTGDKNIEENTPTIIAEEVIEDSNDTFESKEAPESNIKEETTITLINKEVNKTINEEITVTKEIKHKEKTPSKHIEDNIEQQTKISEPQTIVPQKEEKEKETQTNTKQNMTIPDKDKKNEDNVKTAVPRKKTPIKDKIAPTVTKRRRTADATLSTVTEVKPAVESSDDDEIRYMFNPKFKIDETNEGKVFMKVRANKRNSLQIERPNSKDLVKRRTSLQHPPKIPRLKPKAIESKIVPPSQSTVKTIQKIPKMEPAPSTDSDDSDVKYSFPKTVPEKPAKPVQEVGKKPGRKSLAEKRKSLGGIAKRKSMGQSLAAKNKDKPLPVLPIRKRTRDVEHRCDCGQLFSSAALLSRHTSLAHTPPRIRRRRSPPPETVTKPARKSTAKGTTATTPKQAASRKSIKPVAASEARKSVKPETSEPKSSTKVRRPTPAHKGVPVPEKMRKLMQKNKK